MAIFRVRARKQLMNNETHKRLLRAIVQGLSRDSLGTARDVPAIFWELCLLGSQHLSPNVADPLQLRTANLVRNYINSSRDAKSVCLKGPRRHVT